MPWKGVGKKGGDEDETVYVSQGMELRLLCLTLMGNGKQKPEKGIQRKDRTIPPVRNLITATLGSSLG